MNCPECKNGVLMLIGDLQLLEDKGEYEFVVTDQIKGKKGIGVYCCSVETCGHIKVEKAAPGLISQCQRIMRSNRRIENTHHQLLHS